MPKTELQQFQQLTPHPPSNTRHPNPTLQPHRCTPSPTAKAPADLPAPCPGPAQAAVAETALSQGIAQARSRAKRTGARGASPRPGRLCCPSSGAGRENSGESLPPAHEPSFDSRVAKSPATTDTSGSLPDSLPRSWPPIDTARRDTETRHPNNVEHGQQGPPRAYEPTPQSQQRVGQQTRTTQNTVRAPPGSITISCSRRSNSTAS